MSPAQQPVRDHNGCTVWRVRVGKGELTCTVCGEIITPTENICWRCGKTTGSIVAVPTLSYLKAGEYELV